MEATALPSRPYHREIDWPALLSGCDMVWKEPATPHKNHMEDATASQLTEEYSAFGTAPFLGNGVLGAMLWQERSGLRIETNRADAWDKREGCKLLYGRERLRNGYYFLRYTGSPTDDWNLRLSLWDAKLTGTISTTAGAFSLTAFVHAQKPLLVVHLVPQGGEQVNLDFVPVSCSSTRPQLCGASQTPLANESADGYGDYAPPVRSAVGGVSLSSRHLTNRADGKPNPVPNREGRMVNGWCICPAPDGSLTLLATLLYENPVESGASLEREACRILEAAQNAGWEALLREHTAWWHVQYQKSFVSLPEQRLESFYWIQVYKTLSAVRENGSVLDLYGPWYKPSGWSAVWTNLNVQMAYAAVYTANHAELGNSLARWLNTAQLERCAARSKIPGMAQGAMALPCVTTAYDIEGTVSRPEGVIANRSTIGNLPYCLIYLWQQYQVTQDTAFLKDRLVPLLRGALLYYKAFLERDEAGVLHLPYTWSPEWGVNTQDTNFDLALLRWLCHTLLAAGRILHTEDSLADDARFILAHLTAYVQDADHGLYIGRDEPYHASHRHWSHLFCFYPTLELDCAEPENRQLLEVSLRQYMSLPEQYTGFSLVAIASLYCLLGNGNAARKSLDKLLDADFLWPNTMYTEMGELEWPTSETPLAVNCAVQEMLLASRADEHAAVITPFPALPEDWRQAAFGDFLARGGFRVSAARIDGVTDWVSVESGGLARCTVQMDQAGFGWRTSRPGIAVQAEGCSCKMEGLAQGDWVVVYRAGRGEPPFTLSACPAKGQPNGWGGKKQVRG